MCEQCSPGLFIDERGVEGVAGQPDQGVLEPAVLESRLIRNPVDLESFGPGSRAAARERLGIPDEAQVVLVVANLGLANPLKDGATALAAMRRLAAERQGRDLRLLVAGQPGPVERHEGFTVQPVGYVDDPEDLAEHYRAADALQILSGRAALKNFEPLFDELRGDAHAALGDTEAARAAYQKILDNDDAVVDRTYVGIKLDALGGADAGE